MMTSTHDSSTKVLFVLSVDTEEEFDWGGAFPQRECQVENIQLLPEFHRFCQSLGVRPTYLVDYPVAAQEASSAVMKQLLAEGDAEVGAHLHPWCTPPIEGANGERESHVINLPEPLIRQKLEALLVAIEANIGVRPNSFRTGRWGIDSTVLNIIAEHGFTVDSSVYPYYENQYFSCMDACDTPYWPDAQQPNRPGAQRAVYEVPITSGFNRPDSAFWGKMHSALSGAWLDRLHLVGLAWHTRLMRKLFLSPELTTANDMIALVNAALAAGRPVIHMFLHSSTLLEKPGEYNQHSVNRAELYRRIQCVIEHLQSVCELEHCTLSEAATQLQAR